MLTKLKGFSFLDKLLFPGRSLIPYAEEVDIPLHGYGSTTFGQEAKARGIEPDECYGVGSLKPLPNVAIEDKFNEGPNQ